MMIQSTLSDVLENVTMTTSLVIADNVSRVIGAGEDDTVGNIRGTLEPSLFEDDAPTLTTGASIKAAVLALMAAGSLVGNSATLLSIIRRRKGNRSSMYKLLFQLALADLLVSVWCLLGEAAWTYTVEWKGGTSLCKIFKFSQVFSLYLSTSTTVLIGFDRLLAITKPINHRSCFAPIGIAWLISALLASPQFAVFRVLEGPFRQPFYQCVTYGFYTEEWQEQLYSVFSLLTMFVLPLVSLVTCYACIFCTIAKEKERILSSSNSRYVNNTTHRFPSIDGEDPRSSIFQKAKTRSLRISIIIVTAFVVCWAPYYFMMMTFIFLQPDQQSEAGLQSAIFFFGMSNSLINPLIYGAFHLCGGGRRSRSGSANRDRRIAAGGGSLAFAQSRNRRRQGIRRRPFRSHCNNARTTLNVDYHLPKRRNNNSTSELGVAGYPLSSYSHSSVSDHGDSSSRPAGGGARRLHCYSNAHSSCSSQQPIISTTGF